MTDGRDLTAALHGIADGAARAQGARDVDASGGALPVPAIRVDARRRRTRFEVGVGAVAAAVVGAVVLAGSAAGDLADREPRPPAHGTESPVRTDDGWAVDYSECGRLGPEDLGTVPLTVAATADSAALTTVLADVTGGVGVWTLGRNLDVVALDDAGTVVGVLGHPADDPGFESRLETYRLDQSAPLFSCDAQDGAQRLPAGRYGLSVGLRVFTPTGSGAIDGWAYQRSEVVVPQRAIAAAQSLPGMSLDPHPPAQCGDAFPTSQPGEPRADLMVQPHDLVGSVQEDGQPNAVTLQVDVLDTRAPGDGPNRPMADLGATVYLTLDGTVVDVGMDQVQGNWYENLLSSAPGSTRTFDRVFEGRCEAPLLADGAYEVWVKVVLDTEIFVAGPWPLGSIGWAPVDPSALPAGVPLLEERLLRSEANEDGRRWRVDLQLNDAGAAGYERAVGALEDAGFAVVDEQTDPSRPAWRHAELASEEFFVTLDVSNETGEGFYADYVITAQP